MEAVLCTCNGRFPLDRSQLAREGGDGLPVRVWDVFCRSVSEVRGPAPDAVFLGCARGTREYRAALERAGVPAHRIVAWDLADAFYGRSGRENARVAAGAIRAATALVARAVPAKRWAVDVGPRVLVAGEGGEPVARALAGHRDVLWVAPGVQPVPGVRVHPGRIVGVEGGLGGFRVEVRDGGPADPWACVGCGACREACPRDALDRVLRLDPDRCDGCGRCEAACARVGALDLGRSPGGIEADQVVWFGGDAVERPGLFVPRTLHDVAAVVCRVVALEPGVEAWASVVERPGSCGHARAGLAGCSLCRDRCPAAAVNLDAGGAAVAHDRCTGCGGCAGACPTGALDAVPWGGGAVGAALERLGRSGVAVSLRCEHGGDAPLPGELPVGLPHLGGAGWLPAVVALGAGARRVRYLPCPVCAEAVRPGFRLARAVMERVGRGGSVLWGSAPATGAVARPWLDGGDLSWGDPVAVRAELLAPLLPETPSERPLGGPFGSVDARARGCTACGACVGVCPTGALRADSSSPEVSFVGLRCTGCGLCAAACPESVLVVEPGLAWQAGEARSRVLARADALACPACNRVFGTRQALDAVLARLGSGFPGVDPELLGLCPDCRAVEALRDA